MERVRTLVNNRRKVFLVMRVHTRTDEARTLEVFSRRSGLGDPTQAESEGLARRSGYELKPRLIRALPGEWPLAATFYKSGNREGKGRVSGQFHTYFVRRRNHLGRMLAPPA